jgi:hypothetical protein
MSGILKSTVRGLRSSAFDLNSRNPDFIERIGNTDLVILQKKYGIEETDPLVAL